MPLTPTDVANKQFRIAFRGYSLDEVDAFLDEVETELTRLLRERSAAPATTAEAASPAAVSQPTAAAGTGAAPTERSRSSRVSSVSTSSRKASTSSSE